MRDNVEVALRANTDITGGPGDWLLNSALGLLVGAYCDALGSVVSPAATKNSERFHSFATMGLGQLLRPDPNVNALLQVLTPKAPFDHDAHHGAFVFWRIYRTGFTHSFAPATKELIEFRWGRYPTVQNAWVRRERNTCVGETVCQPVKVDVIDLNVHYLGEVFLQASWDQEARWRADVSNGVVTWAELLRRLQRA